jgi:hypothetical protein
MTAVVRVTEKFLKGNLSLSTSLITKGNGDIIINTIGGDKLINLGGNVNIDGSLTTSGNIVLTSDNLKKIVSINSDIKLDGNGNSLLLNSGIKLDGNNHTLTLMKDVILDDNIYCEKLFINGQPNGNNPLSIIRNGKLLDSTSIPQIRTYFNSKSGKITINDGLVNFSIDVETLSSSFVVSGYILARDTKGNDSCYKLEGHMKTDNVKIVEDNYTIQPMKKDNENFNVDIDINETKMDIVCFNNFENTNWTVKVEIIEVSS